MAKKPEPIVIKKDTAEPQDCYEFKAEYWKGRVTPFRKALRCGDYTLQGYENELIIERKTLSDFIGSITAGRERFENMWKRCMPESERWLLCEGERFIDRLSAHQYRGDTGENSALGTLVKWSKRYQFTPFEVPDSAEGEKVIYRICYQFLKERAKPTKVAVDHWDYLGQAVDFDLARENWRGDTQPRKVKRNGEQVTIVPHEEWANARTMLAAARAATKGRRG